MYKYLLDNVIDGNANKSSIQSGNIHNTASEGLSKENNSNVNLGFRIIISFR